MRRKVADAMRTDVEPVSVTATVGEVLEQLEGNGLPATPVVEENDCVLGSASRRNIEGRARDVPVRSVTKPLALSCHRDDNLDTIVHLMEVLEVPWLVVMERDQRFAGIITREAADGLLSRASAPAA